MTEEEGKKRRKAVALRYNPDLETAPRVVAKGSGILAERIMEIAKEHGVHITEDPDLVALLSKLNVETVIPDELYKAVAEVLAFVYRLNQGMPGPALKR